MPTGGAMTLEVSHCRGALVGGLLAVAASLPVAGDAPVHSADELEERARVRVHAARVRIEPTSRARPGECLDLGIDDLKVRLRGELVEGADILELERDRRPAIHALLIDTSGSMFGQLDRVRAAASAYVERLDPEHDRAFVATFDESVLLASAVTRDRETLLAAIRDIRMSQLTSLNDGLYYTILELRAQRERPVILLLSDGMDTVSFYERHDVYDLVQRTPDLSVFTIGLALPYLQSRMAPGTLSTKRFLQRIASKTNGKYFDVPTAAGVEEVYLRIRDMLENEATLNVVDPDPEAEPGQLKVSSRSPACKIKVFKTWEAPEDDPTTMPIVEASGPLPRRFPLPAPPDYRKPYVESRRPTVDPACRAEVDQEATTLSERPEPAWFIEVDGDRVRGCGLDVTLDYGVLYDPYGRAWMHFNKWIGLKTRPFEMPVPPIDKLPVTPVASMDRLADLALERVGIPIETDPRKVPVESHARPYHDLPAVVQGTRFLEMRPRLARALYAHPEYRKWVLERLRRETETELTALMDRYRRRFPETDEALLERVLRETDEARRIQARARTPSEVDLQRWLAAWLGDVSAHDLFVAWEVGLVNRWLDEAPPDIDSLEERWTALRALLFVPSYSRVLGLLSPVHDPEADRIGYWRVVLPRPGWMQTRMKGYGSDLDLSDLPLDLVPEVPMALWLFTEIARTRPELIAGWREQGYRVASIAYDLTSKPAKHDPIRAFRETRLTLSLETGGGEADGPRLELTAEISFRRKASERTLERLEVVPAEPSATGSRESRSRLALAADQAPDAQGGDVAQ
jgi:Mg-chelatase subunit ChlD